MQSQKSSKKQGRIPLSLPWGYGSMAWHGQKWWLTWRDAEGQMHYDNSNTEDAAEAQRLMAKLVLPRAQAMAALIERVANGEETYRDAPKRKGAKRPRPRSVTPVGAAPSAPPRKTGSEKGGQA